MAQDGPDMPDMEQTPETLPEASPVPETSPEQPERGFLSRWTRRLATGLMVVLAGLAALFVILDSAIGHRFVIDRIAQVTPGSGLRVRIGRIDGSLFGASTLRDVVLSDPQGRFMTVPEVELDWRPLSWLHHGLDIRTLVFRRGTLWRTPKMNPGDPNAPILPDFDIRIDRFALENLTVAKGVIGQRRHIDVSARADIRAGRAIVDVRGRLGGHDRLLVHLDSEPDRDRFEMGGVYDAPRDGLLASLSGIRRDIHVRVAGRGRFADWHGYGWAQQDGRTLAGFLLDNRSGAYRLAGRVYPGDLVKGVAAQALGTGTGAGKSHDPHVSLVYQGTFLANRAQGTAFAVSPVFRAMAQGGLDLAANRAQKVKVRAQVARPDVLLGSQAKDIALGAVRLDGTLDGAFTDLSFAHVLTMESLRAGTYAAQGLRTEGTVRWNGHRLVVPLALTARQLRSGQATIDPYLPGARLAGDIVVEGKTISSDPLTLHLKGLDARMTLRGDLARGGYAAAGPITARGLRVPNVGTLDGTAKILFKIGDALPWSVQANLAGRLHPSDNATLADLAGGDMHFAGSARMGGALPASVRKFTLTAPKLSLTMDGTLGRDGTGSVIGAGRSADYGAFSVDARMAHDGPHAQIVLDSPLPAAGIRDVRLGITPIPQGIGITVEGLSRLGTFNGSMGLFSGHGQPTRLQIQFLRVWQTDVSGGLELGAQGISGDLGLHGGGIDGTVHLAPQDGAQAVKALLLARNAKFGGDKPIAIGNAKLDVDGLFGQGNSTLNANLAAQGIAVGKIFVGRMAASATLVNGSGSVTASVAGRRGTQFALQGTAAYQDDRIIAYVAGNYAGRTVDMPRRLVLVRDSASVGKLARGWNLEPTQVTFGRGILIAQGHLGGGHTKLGLKVSRMPLSVLDIVFADLGLGGVGSGLIDFEDDGTGAPQGQMAIKVRNFSRSGLVLTSHPVDLYLVGKLDAATLQTRAVVKDQDAVRGRIQAAIADLPRGGTLSERLRGGRLEAQVRYSGPAESLWRLSGIEAFDFTGPLGAVAHVSGTLDAPVLTGAMAAKGLRLRSSLIGTDVQNVEATGSFDASHLALQRFSGTTANGGKVVGSGMIDLSDIATRGVGIDLRLAASNAQLIRRDDMTATVTGPLRVIKNETGGVIAGRVRIDQASWALGKASAAADLPTIPTREINAPADAAPPKAASAPWSFMIDAYAENRVNVRGMGLDSEWGADIQLRGTTVAPQITGTAEVVRGAYEFAGKRFDLSRGRIRFTGTVPIDPQLDIVATGDANGVNASITITGTAAHTSIAFSSTPSLPEEELLSRLLFGTSITQISAPEAVQLAAALASLRGGGGMDPINKVRSAIGLDRLRIVGADATTGRGTSIAVGKYLGRRFYMELVTDGRGYNATSIEFRMTRFLALLGTLSTMGNEQISVRASKDY